MRAKLTLKHGAVTQNQFYDESDIPILHDILLNLMEKVEPGYEIHIEFFVDECDKETKPKETSQAEPIKCMKCGSTDYVRQFQHCGHYYRLCEKCANYLMGHLDEL